MSYKTVRCKVSNCPFCNHADVVFLERDWDEIGNSMVEMKLLVCDCCDNVWEQKGDKVFFLDEAMTNHAKQTAGYQYHKALSKGFVWIEKETPYGGNPRSEDVIVSGQAGDEKIGVVAGK